MSTFYTSSASSTSSSGVTVTFSGGNAVGGITGSGYVAGGTLGANSTGEALTTFTDPRCPSGDGQLTGGSGQGCAATSWTSAGDANGLCMSGTIPALTACPMNCGARETGFDYSEDWARKSAPPWVHQSRRG